jgi:hypothetical protein
MDADRAQVITETRLKKPAGCTVERTAARANSVANVPRALSQDTAARWQWFLLYYFVLFFT